MHAKKQHEEEHEKQLEEAVTGFKLFRTRKEGGGSFRHTRRKITELRRAMQESFSGTHAKVAPKKSVSDMEKQMKKQREDFMQQPVGSQKIADLLI